MARIARKNLKIFAGNASNNGVFGSFQAGSPTTTNDVETIQSLPAWAEGWNSATMTSKKLPPLQEFQGVQYVSTYQLGYLFQEGIAEWDEDCEYHEGSWVKSSASGIWSLYQSKINNNIGNSVLDTSKWALVSLGGSSRNVGEIVASTIPLSDAGLHLLDGSLLTGAGAYSAFVDYIASIYAVNKNYFCSEADWQNSVATYGVCGKFVYSSLNNTVRLPKITGFIEGTSGASDLGNVVEAGLPNIEGVTQLSDDRQTQFSGAFFKASGTSPNSSDSGVTSGTLGFDASRSSAVYGNSNTVQPQAINVLYYIVVGTSTKTQVEIDINQVMSDLNGKADVDLGNCTAPHIVDTYSSSSGWYRIWSDGWCEQGGIYDVTTSSPHLITLPKEMANNTYWATATPGATSGDATVQIWIRYDLCTTTQLAIQKAWTSNNGKYYWEVKGYIS